ncbi:MAG: hypothetical protein ABJA76_09445 [Mucilaginibacter sp.]
MKNKVKYMVMLLSALVFSFGCHKDGHKIPPAKATLTFPAQNALCTSGDVISATQSSIIFTWNASAATSSYEISVKNLLTAVVTVFSSSTNQVTATLLRNTPYSWYVVSKSTTTTVTAQSDTWKFYLAGAGVTSYSPFPATITAPIFGLNLSAGTTAVNLTWTGSDVDNDLATYDVYFGTASNPPLLKSGVTNMFLNAVPLTAGNTYYWKVITKDSQGNTSDSGVYKFKVN